jgi:hypothetical protein
VQQGSGIQQLSLFRIVVVQGGQLVEEPPGQEADMVSVLFFVVVVPG